MYALVTDGDLVGAVSGLRGLHAGGVRTVVTAPERRAPGLLSRCADVRAVGPDAADDPEGFAAHVADLGRRHGPLVVYPSREESIDALVGADLGPAVHLPWADPAALGVLRHKRELPALAAQAGIAAPRTLAEGPAGELAHQAIATPAVVKPDRRGPGIPEVTAAHTPAELAERLAAVPPGESVVVQEHLAGPLCCLALVLGPGGEVVERFQQVVSRVFPLDAGAATVASAVAPDEALCAAAARLLAATGFTGLAQLDFLLTPDGPRLIDVNPRFYISLSLALASGVNLPAAWHAVATGASWPGPTAYRPGRSYRRLESDVAAAVQGTPRLLLARPPRPVVGAIWSARDPVPGASVAVRRIAAFAAGRARRSGPAE